MSNVFCHPDKTCFDSCLQFLPEKKSRVPRHLGQGRGSHASACSGLGGGRAVPGVPGATPRRWLLASMCKGPARWAAALVKDLLCAWPQRWARKTQAGSCSGTWMGPENACLLSAAASQPHCLQACKCFLSLAVEQTGSK